MASKIIGRIAVKVYPDTSTFGKEAKARLDAEERRLDRNAPKVQIRVDGKHVADDTEKVARTAQKVARKKSPKLEVEVTESRGLKAKVQAINKRVESYMDKVDVDLNVRRDSLDDLANDLKRVARDYRLIHTRVEIAPMNAELRRRREEMRKTLGDLRMHIGVETKDLALAEDAADRLHKSLEKTAKRWKIAVNLDLAKHAVRNVEDLRGKLQEVAKRWTASLIVDSNKTAIRAVSARLAVLTRARTVEIFAKLNSASVAGVASSLAALSGLRVMGDLGKGVGDFLRNLDRATPKIAAVTTGVLALSAAVISTVGQLGALGAGLAQAAGAGLALPGIFGGMAIGLGITVVALKDFSKVLPDVVSSYKELGAVVSDNFWAKASTPIRELANTLLPGIRRGLSEASSAIGDFFGSFATSLKTELGGGALDAMFRDLTKSINIAKNATPGLAQAIRILGQAGAGVLPRLAQGFVDVTKQTAAWLAEAEKSGRLDQIINTGIEALKALGSILVNLVGIFAAVGRAASAAAGGSGIGAIADALKRANEVMNSWDVQAQLAAAFAGANALISAFFESAGQGLSNLLRALSDVLLMGGQIVGSTIGTAVGAIADALARQDVKDGLVSALQAFQRAVNILAPAMPALGDAFGALLTLVGQVAEALAGPIAAAIPPLSHAFQVLAPIIGAVATALGQGLTAAIEILSPFITAIADQFKKWFDDIGGGPGLIQALSGPLTNVANAMRPVIDALIEILPKFWDMVTVIGSALYGALVAISPHLEPLGRAFGTILSWLGPLLPILGQFVAKMIELGAQVIAIVAPALERFVDAMTPIVGAVTTVAGAIMTILLPAFGWIVTKAAEAVAGVLDGFSNLIGGIGQIFSGIGQVIQGAWTLILGLMSGNGSRMLQGWRQIWGGLGSILSGAWRALGGLLSVLWNVAILTPIGRGFGLLRGLFSGGFSGLLGIVSGIMGRLIGLLGGIFGRIGGVAMGAIGRIRGIFSSGFGGAVSAVSGRMGQMVSTIASRLGAATSAVRSRMSQIVSTIGSRLSSAASAAASRMSQIAQVISSRASQAVSAVHSKFSQIVSAVRSKLASARSAVSSAMSSIRSAISSGANAARAAMVAGFTAMVAAVRSAVSSMLGVVRQIPGQIRGALGGLGGLLVGAGRAVIGGLVRGITSMFGAVRGALGKLTSMFPRWKGPVTKDKVLLTPAGRTIINGLIAGVQDRIPQVQRVLESLTKDIASIDMRGMSATGREAMQRLAQGVKDGSRMLDFQMRTVETQMQRLSQEMIPTPAFSAAVSQSIASEITPVDERAVTFAGSAELRNGTIWLEGQMHEVSAAVYDAYTYETRRRRL